MKGQTKRPFSTKNDATGQENDFFWIFFSATHLHVETKLFLFLPKLHIFSRSDKSWGDKKNVNFQLKMTPQAKKMNFFGIFFFSCTSSRRDETFLLLPKFHIISRSEKSWVARWRNDNEDNNEQQQRTTSTTNNNEQQQQS